MTLSVWKKIIFTFFHRNPERTIFDVVVDQQGMDEVKEQLYNPLKNLIFGGRLSGDNLVYNGTRRGHYAGTEYLAWMYKSKKPTYKQSARNCSEYGTKYGSCMGSILGPH